MSADFFDSNVFVYLFDEAAPDKRGIAQSLVRNAIETRSACISHQVVQETLNVLTRKFVRAPTSAHAQAFFEQFLLPLWQGKPCQALFTEALRLKSRYQFSFYDSLIVAAALEAGCKRLLSEDLQHGQRIEGLRIENPFRLA